jgi:glutamyl-Q tRNA(Asp) synthetase
MGSLGDVVIRRRDGIIAYQLAVVVDDANQAVSDVVRGADLLPSTPWQLLLQQALGLESPRHAHLPLVVEPDGSKLAKSRHSIPVDPKQGSHCLVDALHLLRQAPPMTLRQEQPAAVLSWALSHWDPGRLACVTKATTPPVAP